MVGNTVNVFHHGHRILKGHPVQGLNHIGGLAAVREAKIHFVSTIDVADRDLLIGEKVAVDLKCAADLAELVFHKRSPWPCERVFLYHIIIGFCGKDNKRMGPGRKRD